ncbi:MAG: hypothetical protein V4726_13885 [Verrucomicrobiota bacterium]
MPSPEPAPREPVSKKRRTPADLLQSLWNSGTVTSWANMGAQSARLLLVLPLLLNRFSEVEVAAWLLFSSAVIFSSIVVDQFSNVASRMVALAAGGAADLKPFRAGQKKASGEENWNLLRGLFKGLSSFGLILAVITAIAVGLAGTFGLEGLTAGYAGSDRIWTAFSILIAGEAVRNAFFKYGIVLRGLNLVALTNRWEALFAVISSLAGALCLYLDGSIVALTLVIQTFRLIGVLRLRVLLLWATKGNLTAAGDKLPFGEIFHSMWTPFWRSLVRDASNRGAVQFCTLVFVRNSSAELAASVMLCLRLTDTASQISLAPLKSKIPKFARLLSKGAITKLSTELQKATRLSQYLLVAIYLGILLAGPWMLTLIHSKVQLPPFHINAALLVCALGVKFLAQTMMISAIGNNIVATTGAVAGAAISFVCAPWLISSYGVNGLLVSAYLPQILCINIVPLMAGCRMLSTPPGRYVVDNFAVSWAVFAGGLTLGLYKFTN